MLKEIQNSLGIAVQRERTKFINQLLNLRSFQLNNIFELQSTLLKVSLNKYVNGLRELTGYLGSDLSTSFLVFIVNYGVCRTLYSISNFGFYDILPTDGDIKELIEWAEKRSVLKTKGRIGDIVTDGKRIGIILDSPSPGVYTITQVINHQVETIQISKKIFKPLKFIDLHGLYGHMLQSAGEAFKKLIYPKDFEHDGSG